MNPPMSKHVHQKRIAPTVAILILLGTALSLFAADRIVFYRDGLKNLCIGAAHGDTARADALLAKIHASLGDRDSYNSDDVAVILQIVQESTVSPNPRSPTVPTTAPGTAKKETPKLKPRPLEGWAVIPHALTHPLIRQSYTDVIPGEDPTVAQTANNISGALFSYTHDGKTNKDVWSTQAALILPFIWHNGLAVGWNPIAAGFIPSASLDKVTGNAVASKNVDSLIFRSGLYGLWLAAGPRPGAPLDPEALRAELSVLGSFTYGTDTNFRLSLPGGDINFEPRIYFSKFLGVGYEIDKHGDVTNPKDIDFSYQLRGWLHAEGGVLQHEGFNQTTPQGDFFRLGPEAQLKLMFPKLLLKGVTLQAEIHYLAPLTGAKGRNPYYFTTSAEVAILKNPELNQQLGFKISYEDGSLDFTKQNVDDFKFSLSLSF
jgi:hypothetical protein